MSLVSSYVFCKNLNIYKNLMYRDNKNQWFICFDDEEPPEFVVRVDDRDKPVIESTSVLHNRGFIVKSMRFNGVSGRIFGSLFNKDPFVRAASFSFMFNGAAPIPNSCDEFDEVLKTTRVIQQGVIWGIQR